MDSGIVSTRIVLGGFSQGGAMSVFTGLTGDKKLGGVFGLSCYLLLSDRIKSFIPEQWENKNTPFFLAHGEDDDIVKYQYGSQSAEKLKELGVTDVEFNTYRYVPPPGYNQLLLCGIAEMLTNCDSNLGHSADPTEIQDLENFFSKVIPAENGQSAGL